MKNSVKKILSLSVLLFAMLTGTAYAKDASLDVITKKIDKAHTDWATNEQNFDGTFAVHVAIKDDQILDSVFTITTRANDRQAIIEAGKTTSYTAASTGTLRDAGEAHDPSNYRNLRTGSTIALSLKPADRLDKNKLTLDFQLAESKLLNMEKLHLGDFEIQAPTIENINFQTAVTVVLDKEILITHYFKEHRKDILVTVTKVN